MYHLPQHPPQNPACRCPVSSDEAHVTSDSVPRLSPIRKRIHHHHHHAYTFTRTRAHTHALTHSHTRTPQHLEKTALQQFAARRTDAVTEADRRAAERRASAERNRIACPQAIPPPCGGIEAPSKESRQSPSAAAAAVAATSRGGAMCVCGCSSASTARAAVAPDLRA